MQRNTKRTTREEEQTVVEVIRQLHGGKVKASEEILEGISF